MDNIESFSKEDYPRCAIIYQEGMSSGIATFEINVPDWEDWDAKYLKPCRFVYKNEGVVMGWCALTPFSSREVYKGVAEVTIYIAREMHGKGIGKYLLDHLILESEKAGFWTLQAKIFTQNSASIRLHEKCGFKIVGVRKKLGMRDGFWHDNVLMERRSKLFI